ncbi:MAG: hypothetical protein CMM61_11725 [Rhodospirillaceae bacterium]|nr:hypothetical protein [Rhodospirillaceae bacterium]
MQRFVHIYLLTAAALVAVMLLSAAAIAAPRVPDAEPLAINPLIRTAASMAPGADCIRHARTGTGEVLVNRCDACMVVGVTRLRRGIAVPEVRKFNVMGGMTLDLPFRGPGRTNLGAIYPCKQANLVKPETMADTDKRCITLETDRQTGGVFLVNNCRGCRAASVLRMANNGRPLGRQAYVIGGMGNLRLSSQGAAKVGLMGEDDCPTSR